MGQVAAKRNPDENKTAGASRCRNAWPGVGRPIRAGAAGEHTIRGSTAGHAGNFGQAQRGGSGTLDFDVLAKSRPRRSPGLLGEARHQLHGRGLSGCCLGNLLTASGIEALPATRLYELWLEQKLLGGKVTVRAGQLAADTEFLVTQYGSLFVNATFGWPAITAANLPGGGPSYPLATPGVRLKLAPTDSVSVLLAAFNGDLAGPGSDDPQRKNRSGTNFRVRDPALLLGEVSYSYHQGKDAAGLPGILKLGGYHHFGRFNDQRSGIDGLSLADPDSAGIARSLRGASGIYGVLDQLLYRVPGTTDQGLGLFVRAAASPSDRDLISFYADGGVTYKGLLPGRENDTVGVSVSYARVSDATRGLDRDAARFGGQAGSPIRSSEMLVEATYQAQVVPGFTVQPDFQYIIRPGGNVPNPRNPNGAAIKNAALVGLRATIRY